MKTKANNVFKSVFLISLMITTVILISCNSADKPASKVEAPSMDLNTAVLFGDLKSVSQHIEAGSDLNRGDSALGSTPLIIAAVFDRTEIAAELIEAGADLNVRSNDGSTALHSAAFLCRLEIAQMLIDNGADKNVKNIYGSIPYETVVGPFADVKFIYDQFSKDLGPMGLKLDYEYIEKTRPLIADLLK